MEDAVIDVRDETREAAPYKTGDLYASILTDEVSDDGSVMRSALFSDLDRALFLDGGTKPHEITPIGEGYPLRFFWPTPNGPGEEVRFMKVNHPGNRAYNFFRVPLPERFQRLLQAAMERQT